MWYYKLDEDIKVQKSDSNNELSFLYNTIIGRLFLKIMISRTISKVYAKYMNSSLSKYKIKKFIKKNNINMSEYKTKDYLSFNDFFKREIIFGKRIINKGLISVCDSKLTAYKIEQKSSFKIKNSIYTIDELIQDDSSKFNFEYALIFRLGVDDYHHYIFPDDGKIISTKSIKGILHTVQPLAFKRYKVFNENSRCVTFLECKNYGKVCYIEVGAMMIGKIVNDKKHKFIKGEEKGHFEFGGSTIILLFEKNKIKINNKILKNSQNGIETIVKMGENLE